MITAWTPELINEAIATLPEADRRAIECWLSDLTQNVGIVRAKKFGFNTQTEFNDHLKSGIEAFKEYFADLAIFSVDDLPFPEQGRSSEGRFQPEKKPKEKKTEKQPDATDDDSKPKKKAHKAISGVRGVFPTRQGRWCVQIARKYHGTFMTVEEAAVVAGKVYAERTDGRKNNRVKSRKAAA